MNRSRVINLLLLVSAGLLVLSWMFITLTQPTPAEGACSVYAGSRDGLTAKYDGEAYAWTAKNDTVFGFSTGLNEEMYLTRGCAVHEMH